MKKLMAFALVLVMLLSCAAIAESAPSKTSDDEVAVMGVVSALTGEPIDLLVKIVKSEDMKQQVANEIETFSKKLSEGSKAIECFSLEIQEKIAEKIPETDDLEINEIAPLFVDNYVEEYGDVHAAFKFITAYAPGQKLVAAVGIYADEGSEADWYILDAEALEGGTVKVSFTGESLEAIQSTDAAVIVILNTKA